MTKARDTANLTGSGVGLSLLDIDAGTDIGAALVDADLMIVDDGAGGTNRKATMSRLATYMGTKIGGGMEFIASSGAISNAASVQFRAQDGHFDSTKYDHYVFYFQHVVPATDDVNAFMQTSTNDGGAYATSSGDYHHNTDVDAIGLIITQANQVGSDTNEFGISGKFHLYSPHTTAYTYSFTDVVFLSNDAGSYIYHGAWNDPTKGASVRLAAEDVDAVKFLFSSGNIESGEITMFGIVNS